jgi:hypothetical protein
MYAVGGQMIRVKVKGNASRATYWQLVPVRFLSGGHSPRIKDRIIAVYLAEKFQNVVRITCWHGPLVRVRCEPKPGKCRNALAVRDSRPGLSLSWVCFAVATAFVRINPSSGNGMCVMTAQQSPTEHTRDSNDGI